MGKGTVVDGGCVFGCGPLYKDIVKVSRNR